MCAKKRVLAVYLTVSLVLAFLLSINPFAAAAGYEQIYREEETTTGSTVAYCYIYWIPRKPIGTWLCSMEFIGIMEPTGLTLRGL